MESKFVNIGLIQSKVSQDLDANLINTIRLIKKAAKQGAQIICLQELFRTPYFPKEKGVNKDLYSEKISSDTIETLKGLAKELEVVIIVPIFEKERKKYFNTAVVISQSGDVIGKYHKIHIPQDPGFFEKDYFEEGKKGYKIFNTQFGTFAVLICYDQWFPEAAREAKLAGAEMIFYPTAIGTIPGDISLEGDWHDAWETVMRGHAIANSIPVAAANRVGIEDGTEFWGQSFICDAFGKVIKRGSKIKDQVVVAKIDLAMNEYIDEGWGFTRNRRPDTYRNISKKRK